MKLDTTSTSEAGEGVSHNVYDRGLLRRILAREVAARSQGASVHGVRAACSAWGNVLVWLRQE